MNSTYFTTGQYKNAKCHIPCHKQALHHLNTLSYLAYIATPSGTISYPILSCFTECFWQLRNKFMKHVNILSKTYHMHGNKTQYQLYSTTYNQLHSNQNHILLQFPSPPNNAATCNYNGKQIEFQLIIAPDYSPSYLEARQLLTYSFGLIITYLPAMCIPNKKD